jgi:hypothetical protein
LTGTACPGRRRRSRASTSAVSRPIWLLWARRFQPRSPNPARNPRREWSASVPWQVVGGFRSKGSAPPLCPGNRGPPCIQVPVGLKPAAGIVLLPKCPTGLRGRTSSAFGEAVLNSPVWCFKNVWRAQQNRPNGQIFIMHRFCNTSP